MDIKHHTKITVLIEKIGYLNDSVNQNGGVMSKIDRDLMLGYVKDLYEILLSIQTPDPVAAKPVQESQNSIVPPTVIPPVNHGNGTHLNGHSNNGHPVEKEGSRSNTGSLNTSYAEHNQKTLSESFGEKQNIKPSVNDKLSQRRKELADKLKLSPIKDLKTYIGLNKRFAFTSNLFNSNSMDYEVTIDTINACNTYEEAMKYLSENAMRKYNWNTEDENFIDLHTFIVRRFLD